ncbi:MAG: hypothetical protein ABGZ36_10305, partial [Actinomycetota bacterium]
MTPGMLTAKESPSEKRHRELRTMASEAHLKARQREDLRRDLAERLKPSAGPFVPGHGLWYWDRDMSKIRAGKWIKAKVVKFDASPMVIIEIEKMDKDLGGH